MATDTIDKQDTEAGGGKFTPPDGTKPTYNVERFEKFASLDRDGLKTEGVRLAKSYYEYEKKTTVLLKEIAEVVVAARMKFRDPKQKGIPDWNGNSKLYSDYIQGIYEAAGLPKGTQDGLRNNLKYHVQNLVKQVAPKEHLEKLKTKTEKRGAGGNAGSNNAGTTTPAGQPTVSQTVSANKQAKQTPAAKDPVITLQVIKLEVTNNIKNLAYVTEQIKDGVADNDQRYQVVQTADDIAKLAQELSEQATALCMRHQGRSKEQIEKDSAKAPAKAPAASKSNGEAKKAS